MNTAIDNLSPELKSILNASLGSLNTNIQSYCNNNNINGQNISISDVHGTNCNIKICGSQVINSKVNSGCTIGNNVQVDLQSLSKNFSNNLLSSLKANDKNTQAIQKIKDVLTNDTFINTSSTCIFNSINNQNFTVSGVNATCSPIITTTTDIFGNVVQVSEPGTLNFCDIDQEITSDIFQKCDIINNTLLQALQEYDSLTYPQQTQSPSPITCTQDPKSVEQNRINLIVLGTLVGVFGFVILALIIYGFVLADRKRRMV
jgi:hypothetical protein